MEGKVLRDLIYCEVFCEHDADPMDVALHTGDTVEVLRDFKEYNEDTYLCLVPDGDCVQYATLLMEDIELLQ